MRHGNRTTTRYQPAAAHSPSSLLSRIDLKGMSGRKPSYECQRRSSSLFTSSCSRWPRFAYSRNSFGPIIFTSAMSSMLAAVIPTQPPPTANTASTTSTASGGPAVKRRSTAPHPRDFSCARNSPASEISQPCQELTHTRISIRKHPDRKHSDCSHSEHVFLQSADRFTHTAFRQRHVHADGVRHAEHHTVLPGDAHIPAALLKLPDGHAVLPTPV